MRQIPFLPPRDYSETDLAFIVPRILELTYTAFDLADWAHDLGYDGQPFVWDENRRAQFRAELDAWYARAYGLTRDELRYILDPAEIMGPDYPSETFRVLKNNEMRLYREYRTQRLVLGAWDLMDRGELPVPESYDQRRYASPASIVQPAGALPNDRQGLLQFTAEPIR